MVFANGNAGPDEATRRLAGELAEGDRRRRGHQERDDRPRASIDVTAPAPVPADLVGHDVRAAPTSARRSRPPSARPPTYRPRRQHGGDGKTLGCSLAGDVSPFPAGSLTGEIALIERGICDFSEKVFNAQRAGAIAAIIYNSAAERRQPRSRWAPARTPTDITIPSWFMRRSQGLAMRDYAIANPGTAQAKFDLRAADHARTPADVMAGFSSRGPTTDKCLKPDVVAPGVDVLSSGYGVGDFPAPFTGFGSASGTSMATPHVAGAAALLVQLHPNWTPAQMKSALMTTATEDVWTNTAHDRAGGRARPRRRPHRPDQGRHPGHDARPAEPQRRRASRRQTGLHDQGHRRQQWR